MSGLLLRFDRNRPVAAHSTLFRKIQELEQRSPDGARRIEALVTALLDAIEQSAAIERAQRLSDE